MKPKQSPLHDENGKFKKGNPGGPGNPKVRQMAAYRQALFNAGSEEDVKKVIHAMRDACLNDGDVTAGKEYLMRMCGPYVAVDLLERISNLEELLKERKK